jgi:hypothetical protein
MNPVIGDDRAFCFLRQTHQYSFKSILSNSIFGHVQAGPASSNRSY